MIHSAEEENLRYQRRVGEFTDHKGYKCQVPESSLLDYLTAFEFENEDLEQFIKSVDPGNTVLTEEMASFTNVESIVQIKEKKVRMMFYLDNYTQKENEKIREFKELCVSKGIPVPENDPEILRFLYSRKMNPQAALDAIQAKYNFRNEKFPLMITPGVRRLIEAGFIYICGRDKRLRTLSVLTPKVILDINPDIEDLIKATVVMQLYMIHFMEKPGVVENNVSIINLQGLGLLNIPYGMVKTVLQTTQGQFKGRARTIICLNAPTTISIAWNTIWYFLDELTAQKVSINSQGTCLRLFEFADPSQVEEKFGGKAANVTSFWPPRLASMEFGQAPEI